MKEDFVNPKKHRTPGGLGKKPCPLASRSPLLDSLSPTAQKGARFIDLKGPIHHWKPVGRTHCLPKFKILEPT